MRVVILFVALPKPLNHDPAWMRYLRARLIAMQPLAALLRLQAEQVRAATKAIAAMKPVFASLTDTMRALTRAWHASGAAAAVRAFEQ